MFMDYDVAVIGAGIIGASIAARLSSAGMAVALLEKGVVGASGASGFSGGLVRLYDPDPLLMDLAAFSIGQIHDGVFASTYAKALQRSGALYCAAPEQTSELQRAIERHASAEYPMRLISAQELNGMHFAPIPEGERVILFEPHACVGNVRLATHLLADVVRSNGLLLEHCEVQSIDCHSRHEVHVGLGASTLRCRALVVAAGGWSRQWVPELKLETRSIPLARVLTDADCGMPIIDAVSQSYLIPLTRHIAQTGCGFRDIRVSPSELPPTDARNQQDAARRVRQLTGCTHSRVLDVLPGFDSYSPDGRPLLGVVGEDSPLFLATGMSGLGFKFAPGIACIALEQVQRHLLNTPPHQDWSALSPLRAMLPVAPVGVQP
ncbi:FAD-binding oxidoreductase [Pseudomonas sp. S25]|uniref:FAD-binding oxidoreductase n=1 Tax=Pseudomonas maioricensis TaxID=1766623 RepID=A0ABS9ZJT5_9PSED|nr:FAD-dependent oxidoreductase [Pseudomonas sp. S25]MCI8210851.1 FAD-binding oxidoreductase [Pseudomonas sp. S25]